MTVDLLNNPYWFWHINTMQTMFNNGETPYVEDPLKKRSVHGLFSTWHRPEIQRMLEFLVKYNDAIWIMAF